MSDQADRLVELALKKYELGRSDDGLPFLVEKNGLRVARPMTRGGDLSKTLAAGFYDHFEGSVPSGAAITDAMSVLEGIALRSDQTIVFRRIAQVGERIEVDLGDSTGRCVEVTPSGWRIVDSPSELFLRTSLTGVLPNPVSGGSIEALRPLVNCDDDQFALAVGFLVSHFHVALQQPVLGITGEQGSTKSSLAGMIVDLGDPSPARLTTPPGSIRDWAIHASSQQLIAIDNVSSIPQWQSDCWCRAVSGDAFTTRKLYTDRELQLMRFRRSVIFTGIAPVLRGDLADRTIRIDLNPIRPGSRRTEADIRAEFQRIRPQLLGAVLDMVSASLRYIERSK